MADDDGRTQQGFGVPGQPGDACEGQLGVAGDPGHLGVVGRQVNLSCGRKFRVFRIGPSDSNEMDTDAGKQETSYAKLAVMRKKQAEQLRDTKILKRRMASLQPLNLKSTNGWQRGPRLYPKLRFRSKRSTADKTRACGERKNQTNQSGKGGGQDQA